MARAFPVLVAAVVLLAGCLGLGSTSEPSGSAPLDPAGTPPGTKLPDTTTPKRDPNLRWHYHNYWGDSPILRLLEENVTLPIVAPAALELAPRSGTVDFTLPYGRLVPPETGELNVTIHFAPTAGLPFTGLNFSYRPAGAVNFTGVAVTSGAPVSIPVSYDQTDVPHRGSTAWRFRLGPEGDGGAALANGTAHVVIEARIGRPLLIDPPHFDQWRGRTAIPLAMATVNATGVKITEDTYLQADPDARQATVRREILEIPLPNGSIVPERTREVVVHLFWNATGGTVKPALAYAEDNSPSNATLAPDSETETSREYRIPIGIGMSDSPYANQSTWRFYVLLEGVAGSAFSGQITLHATAERRA